MKIFVLQLELNDDKDKRKAIKIVSALPGIDSISMDTKEKKLTVVGTVDPISVVSKLRKFWSTTRIISVGPVKEPEKKEEPKKEEAKKEEGNKEEAKKEGEPKKEEVKAAAKEMLPYIFYPPMHTFQYVHPSVEENPNACVIS